MEEDLGDPDLGMVDWAACLAWPGGWRRTSGDYGGLGGWSGLAWWVEEGPLIW